MEDVVMRIAELTAKDSKLAYAALQRLEEESGKSDAVYAFLDDLFQLCEDKNSYRRTRGLLLVIANAQWDAAGRIDAHLKSLLRHIVDEKPITSRQFVQALPRLAHAKPGLAPAIQRALETADLTGYPDSMRLIVAKDIDAARRAITEGTAERT